MTTDRDLTEKNTTIINAFTEKTIITEDDFKKLSSSIDFVKNTFLTTPMYRPLVIKIFGVLSAANCPTPESKYWQCKTEAEVHSQELVRELHDLQMMMIELEADEYTCMKIQDKMQKTENTDEKFSLAIDLKKMLVIKSRKTFEKALLEKKIKYRISELNDWKIISEKLENSGKCNNISDYGEMLQTTLKLSWNAKLHDPKTEESEKKILEMQIKQLDETMEAFRIQREKL